MASEDSGVFSLWDAQFYGSQKTQREVTTDAALSKRISLRVQSATRILRQMGLLADTRPSKFGYVIGTTGVADRLVWVDRVMEDPPLVHPNAPKGVYGTDRECYRFLANHVQQGHRTMETGAGISSALFAAWGCEHLTIVPSEEEVAGIISYLDRVGIDQRKIRFDTNAVRACSAPTCRSWGGIRPSPHRRRPWIPISNYPLVLWERDF